MKIETIDDLCFAWNAASSAGLFEAGADHSDGKRFELRELNDAEFLAALRRLAAKQTQVASESADDDQ